jgi:hypothetical protein
MSNGSRILAVLTLAWLVVLLSPRPAPADDDENLRRLEAMSAEHRQALAKNLERFDALPAPERDAVRTIDRRLAEADPAERTRLLGVLHRYHIWVESLPEDRQKAIRDARPEDRLGLIARYRAEQRQNRPNTAPGDWVQVSALSPKGLEPTALLLKIWFEIDPIVRKEVESIREIPRREQRLRELGRQMGVPQEFRHEHLEFAATVRELNEKRRRWLEANPALKKRLEMTKGRLNNENPAPRLREALYLRDHKPSEPVSAENLKRFEAEMPAWLRETLDPLPSDAARRRLELLYRLAFPPGQELPKKAAGTATDAEPPAPKRSRPSGGPPPRPF